MAKDMNFRKTFIVKRNQAGIELLGDSLSDTEIEERKNMKGGDFAKFGSLKDRKTEIFAAGDGLSVAPPKPQRPTVKAIGEQTKSKHETQLDFRKSSAPSTNKDWREKVENFLEEHRARAQNRPLINMGVLLKNYANYLHEHKRDDIEDWF